MKKEKQIASTKFPTVHSKASSHSDGQRCTSTSSPSKSKVTVQRLLLLVASCQSVLQFARASPFHCYSLLCFSYLVSINFLWYHAGMLWFIFTQVIHVVHQQIHIWHRWFSLKLHTNNWNIIFNNIICDLLLRMFLCSMYSYFGNVWKVINLVKKLCMYLFILFLDLMQTFHSSSVFNKFVHVLFFLLQFVVIEKYLLNNVLV